MGVLTTIDRAALAAYCQAYGRWVEAEEKLKETPSLFKTPSGYVQQSPWLGIANKQLELMGRYMTELGMTPASRSRVAAAGMSAQPAITFTTIYEEDPKTILLEELMGRYMTELGMTPASRIRVVVDDPRMQLAGHARLPDRLPSEAGPHRRARGSGASARGAAMNRGTERTRSPRLPSCPEHLTLRCECRPYSPQKCRLKIPQFEGRERRRPGACPRTTAAAERVHHFPEERGDGAGDQTWGDRLDP